MTLRWFLFGSPVLLELKFGVLFFFGSRETRDHNQTKMKWKLVKGKEKLAGVLRLYAVTTPTGRHLRRTRTHNQVTPQSNKEVEVLQKRKAKRMVASRREC